MSTSRLLAAAAGLVAVVCGAPCHAASGDMVHLGTLPGEPNSVATSINAAGTVLGTSGLRTYVWSRADGMRELTDVDGLIDAADVSDDGAVAGRAWWPGHDWQGFLLTTDRTNLGSLGGIRSAPAAINNHNTVVGTSVTAGYVDHAFRWTPAGGMEDLGAFGPSAAPSHATDVSDTDVVVGYSDYAARAFRWTASSGMIDLGTLGGASSIANAISRDGTTIVGWAHDTVGYQRPFRWTAAGGMTDIGTFGGALGQAVAVNDAGAIVGQATDAAGHVRIALWTPGLPAPLDLNEWLAAVNPSAAADWHIVSVAGINDAGQIIGYGSYLPGAPPGLTPPSRAFVLDVSGIPGTTIPEPAITGAGASLLGVTTLRCRRRRARRS